MSKTVDIERLSNGGATVTVNGGIPRGIDDTVNIIIKPIDNLAGCIVKSPNNEFQIKLHIGDTITINGAPAPTVLADLITVLLGWVFAGTQAYATPTKLAQTITVVTPASVAHTAAPFALQGTDSAGLPIVWTSSDTSKFTIAGNILTPVGAGTANILANAVATQYYAVAAQVSTPYTLS